MVGKLLARRSRRDDRHLARGARLATLRARAWHARRWRAYHSAYCALTPRNAPWRCAFHFIPTCAHSRAGLVFAARSLPWRWRHARLPRIALRAHARNARGACNSVAQRCWLDGRSSSAGARHTCTVFRARAYALPSSAAAAGMRTDNSLRATFFSAPYFNCAILIRHRVGAPFALPARRWDMKHLLPFTIPLPRFPNRSARAAPTHTKTRAYHADIPRAACAGQRRFTKHEQRIPPRTAARDAVCARAPSFVRMDNVLSDIAATKLLPIHPAPYINIHRTCISGAAPATNILHCLAFCVPLHCHSPYSAFHGFKTHPCCCLLPLLHLWHFVLLPVCTFLYMPCSVCHAFWHSCLARSTFTHACTMPCSIHAALHVCCMCMLCHVSPPSEHLSNIFVFFYTLFHFALYYNFPSIHILCLLSLQCFSFFLVVP